MYTVIPPSNAASASCPNVTFPSGPLDVSAVVDNGPLSQYGWVDQCTDISVTPRNGTPPYYFTVAPALHPPYNISSNDNRSLNWTISLSWAAPFFISVVDSSGNSWSNGPLHSGGFGPTTCLVGFDSSRRTRVDLAVVIGVGVGGAVAGLLVGIGSGSLLARKRRRAHAETFLEFNSGQNSLQDAALHHLNTTSQYSPVPSMPTPEAAASLGTGHKSYNSLMHRLTQDSANYHIEPFVMPSPEDGRQMTAQLPVPSDTTSPAESSTGANQAAVGNQLVPPGQVYVVHHDGGRPPVTVYHQEGARVIELPPVYDESSPSRSGVGSDGRISAARNESTEGSTLQPRQAGQTRKDIGGNS
ncbi:hypothetical protein AX17_000733 [Amanita inopinata Kibby_2008]|nr:hypothetical protein AX17_000733 [Amanita inopinata Kibby_2008]